MAVTSTAPFYGLKLETGKQWDQINYKVEFEKNVHSDDCYLVWKILKVGNLQLYILFSSWINIITFLFSNITQV